MKTKYRIICLLIPVFVLGLSATALPQSENQEMDVLDPIKTALEAAGASSLTIDQENSILELVNEFRDTNRILNEYPVGLNAREEYENAILNLDSDEAVSQAAVIANTRADEMALHEEVAAVYAITTIKVLKENSEQYDALVNQIGRKGLVKLILGLFGGPGRGGPGHGQDVPPPPMDADFVL